MDEETSGVESFGEVDYSAAKFAIVEQNHVFNLWTVAWDLEWDENEESSGPVEEEESELSLRMAELKRRTIC